MNNYIKIGLSLVGGAVLGGYFGYKYGLSKAQKLADEQVEDTKKSLRSYYENKIEKIKEEAKEKEEKMNSDMGVDPGIDDVVENKPTAEDRERFQKPSKTLLPTGKLKGEGKAKPKNTLIKEEIIPDPYPDFNDKKIPPYKIFEKDFGDLDDWDTLELILWGDGTVTTDDSMCEVVSPTLLFKLLPEDWPNQFFSEDGKPVDTICYRNNKERRDIQIIRDGRTYREWIEEVWPGRLSEIDDG